MAAKKTVASFAVEFEIKKEDLTNDALNQLKIVQESLDENPLYVRLRIEDINTESIVSSLNTIKNLIKDSNVDILGDDSDESLKKSLEQKFNIIKEATSKIDGLANADNEIEITPKISNPTSFAEEVTKQLTVPAQIDVELGDVSQESVQKLNEIISNTVPEGQETNIPNIQKFIKSLNNLKVDKITDNLTSMYSILDDFAKDVNKLDINDSGLISSLEKLIDEKDALKDLATVVKATKKELEKASDATSNSTQDKEALARAKEYNSIYEKLEKKQINLSKAINSSTIQNDEFNNSILETRDRLSQFLDYGKLDVVSEEDLSKIKTLNSEIDETLESVKGLAKQKSISNLASQISSYLYKNTKMSSSLRRELKEMLSTLRSGASLTKEEFDAILVRVREIDVELNNAGKIGKTFLDQVRNRLSDMDSKLLAQVLSWQDIIRYIRIVAETVTELDTALTEMRKVSEETLDNLKEYQSMSFDIASSIGTTAVNLDESTADFMRLGEALDEASESAQVATILMNVSEFESIDDATESLIAMSAAYSDLEKMDIVDKLNKIGNEYSISTDEVATALQDSASALVTAGNSIDEAIALITAGNAVVQDADKVGNGMRTIALRLTGTEAAAEALEELGEETDGMITTQSKLRETIMDATKVASNNYKGFDILDDNGNYKSTYEIMLGLAELYEEIVAADKELGNNNLNLLLETIAGKNRANIAASILQNPEMLAEAFDDSAINSTNSALEENEKYLESIEGHIAMLQNATQELFYHVLDSGIINNVLTLATKFVNLIDVLSQKLGSLGSIITAGGLAALLRNLPSIIPKLIKDFPELITNIDALITDVIVSVSSGVPLLETLATLLPSLAAAAPYILAIAAATAVVGGLIWVWDSTHESVEEATEAFEDAKNSYSNATEELSNLSSELDDVNDKIKELAKQETLSFTDEEELERLRTQKQLLEENLETAKAIAEESKNSVLNETKNLFNTKFKNTSDTTDIDTLVAKLKSGNLNIQNVLDSAEDNIGDAIALYKYYQNEMSKAKSDDELEQYEEYLKELEDYILTLSPDAISSILEMQQGLFDSGLEKTALYQSLEEFKRLIYSFSNKGTLKELEYEEIFDVTSIEFTRDKLLEMAAAGELDEETISHYGMLRKAIADSGLTVEEFIQQLKAEAAALEDVEEEESTSSTFSYNSLSTAVQNMSERLLPQFEALGEIYDTIFNGDDGFTLEEIDTDALENIRSTFEELDEDLGIVWDNQNNAVEDFISTITDASSTSDEVQQAFNDLATSYFNAAVVAGDFSEANANTLEQMLEQAGVTNAAEIVTKKLAAAEAYNTVQTDLAAGASAEHANSLLTEANASEYARAAAFRLAIAESGLDSDNLDFSSKIAKLSELARAYLDTATAAQIAKKADWANSQVESGNMSEDAAYTIVENFANNLTAKYRNLKVDYGTIDTSSASSAGSDAGDAYADAFEEELEALEKQRDAGIISEKEFLEKYKALIEKYFKDVDGYGEEYAERMADYWDRVIEYMDSVISAITTLIDKRIDSINDSKDEAVDALEEEKEAAEDAYQAQIDYIDELIEAKEAEKDALQDEIDRIQDQIDALQDANDERERAINLQKAQFELQRANNQKTKYVYAGNGQMVKCCHL